MNKDQRSAFESWFRQKYDSELYCQARLEAWQAALKSPEVEALRKDSQRLSAIESDEGADIIRLSRDEWEVSGYAKDLYGTGGTLREAIDNAIKEAEMNTFKNHQEIDTSTERVDGIKLPPPTELYFNSNGGRVPIRIYGYTKEQVLAAIEAALQSQEVQALRDALEYMLESCHAHDDSGENAQATARAALAAMEKQK